MLVLLDVALSLILSLAQQRSDAETYSIYQEQATCTSYELLLKP